MSDDLLPCPFCGGEAVDFQMGGLVGCEPCGLARRDAASWNRRAIPATDAQEARQAAARLLLDMLHMRNGAHEGVTKDDAQAMWEAASTREGYAAVDAFLRSIIGEART